MNNDTCTSLMNSPFVGVLVTREDKVSFINDYCKSFLDISDEFPFYHDLEPYIGTKIDYEFTLNNEVKPTLVMGTRVNDEVLWIIIDTSRLVQTQEELLIQKHISDYNASYDLLTETPNRQGAMGAIEEYMSMGTPFNLMYIDIDNFKTVNDTYGHDIGDEVLKLFVSRLRKIIQSDVYRLSGDEFAAIITGDKQYAIDKANEIIQSNNTNLDYDFNDYLNNIYVTCSIGIVSYPYDTIDIEKLITFADITMYNAKKSGNSLAIFNEQMRISKLQENMIQTDISEGIDRDEFELYYQPQIDSRTNELVGLEALVRWNHPTRGLLFPDTFIPIAEKTGLIVKLDLYLMAKILKTSNLLSNEYGYKYKISANLSIQQLVNNYADALAKIFKKCNGDVDRVKLEITETELMTNHKKSIKELEKLNDMGIELCLDDFGVGYSSLGYLATLPINTIKIDKLFVHKYNTEDVILRSIIDIAKNLKLNTVAEGVETYEQLKYLEAHGCYIIQGWYYDKALKLNDLIDKYFKD